MASLLLRRAILGSTINSSSSFARRPIPRTTITPPTLAFSSTSAALGSSVSTKSSTGPSQSQLNQMSTEVENLVDNAIKENKVVMFAKTTCGYCGQAKRLFNESYPDVKVQIFDLDKRDDGSAIQSYLRDKSKQSTVPNIFINQQHIGGNDKLQAAERNGTLAGLLAA